MLEKNKNFIFAKRKISNIKTSFNLNPFWITGFCDAEGCFSVIISRRSAYNWRVTVSFEINLHIKDVAILYKIEKFFGVGSVTIRPKVSKCVYRVTKIEDLINVIIPHFTSYPLISQKCSDFLLWSKVATLMYTKQHLTSTGFNTILSYYAAINKGMSPNVLSAFPDIKASTREKVILPEKLNPYWVSGFTAGDGGFYVGIRSKTDQIYFRFHITQHSRDNQLMNLFINFFGCGKVFLRNNCNRSDFYIQDFSKIFDIVIPHFDSYPLYNAKSLDYQDFKIAAGLFKSEGKNSLTAIKGIISNMNSKRK